MNRCRYGKRLDVERGLARKPCQSPVMSGKKRCRMHGGAAGSGAPKGQHNGNYRHGFYTADAIAERRAMRAVIRKLAG